jgi:hypothetical protein
VGDKLHGQKGNSPDPPLRSPSPAQWKRMWERADNQDVGLEAATIERVRNSLLVEVFLRRQFNGAMPDTEARGLSLTGQAVGERSQCREVVRERAVERCEVRMPV